MHYADKATYEGKKYERGVRVLPNPKEEMPNAVELTHADRARMLRTKKLLACDPGKTSLLTIGDGKVGGKCLKYTNKDRQFAGAYKARLTRERLVQSQVREGPAGTKYSDLQDYLSWYQSKSSLFESFVNYVEAYWRVVPDLDKLYQATTFRRAKYTTRIRQQASLDKFVTSVIKTFDPKVKGRHKGRNLVIGNGNWGRATNMRNNAPSPGISLRRKVHCRIATVTVCERGTSRVCPREIVLATGERQRCNGALEHPLVNNRKVPGTKIHKHHILRCQIGNCRFVLLVLPSSCSCRVRVYVLTCKCAVNCRKLWDRDVMAAANIHHQFKHNLRHGTNSGAFAVLCPVTYKRDLVDGVGVGV